MHITSVFARFYKSFNFDYLRKVHPKATKLPWEDLDGVWYPHVQVELDPTITTIVGANESGKSHLLSAIEKAITGEHIAEYDICRYSPFFSVEKDRRYWPQLGLECSGISQEEVQKITDLLELESLQFKRFWLFRTEPTKATIYIPGETETNLQRDLSPDQLNTLVQTMLPRPFRINPNIALPDSIPIAWLARSNGKSPALAKLSRKDRMSLLDNLAGLNTEWISSEEKLRQNAANVYNSLFEPAKEKSQDDTFDEKSLELARILLLRVANVDPHKINELYNAVQSSREGYAIGLVEKINDQLSRRLNFPKWWIQDRDFTLRLDLRESDLVFTVRDRTGTEYTFGERSSGLKYFLSYYVQYQAHDRDANHSELLLMDEPDAYLSAEAQQDLMRILYSFAQPDDSSLRPIQVVYVTHSPFLIDKNHSERIKVLEKGSGREGTRVVSNASRNHYEPLRSALGVFVGETAFVGNSNLVVEGQADQIMIAGAANLISRLGTAALGARLDLNRVTLVPAGSAGHIPYVVYLIRGRDLFKPAVLVLLDSDDSGKSAAKRLRQERHAGARLLSQEYVTLIGDVPALELPNVESPELEDLVPLPLAVRAVNRYFDDLASFSVGAGPTLQLSQVQQRLGGKTNTFDAIAQSLKDLVEDTNWHIEKVGFARAVIQCCSDELDSELQDDGSATFLRNAEILFTELNRLKRKAERELLQERIESKVERLKNTFTLDHPTSATREDALHFLEELEEVLDDSREADAIRSLIPGIKRDFDLTDPDAQEIDDFEEFADQLDALKYAPQMDALAADGNDVVETGD